MQGNFQGVLICTDLDGTLLRDHVLLHTACLAARLADRAGRLYRRDAQIQKASIKKEPALCFGTAPAFRLFQKLIKHDKLFFGGGIFGI